MILKNQINEREQFELLRIDQFMPRGHFVRKLKNTIGLQLGHYRILRCKYTYLYYNKIEALKNT